MCWLTPLFTATMALILQPRSEEHWEERSFNWWAIENKKINRQWCKKDFQWSSLTGKQGLAGGKFLPALRSQSINLPPVFANRLLLFNRHPTINQLTKVWAGRRRATSGCVTILAQFATLLPFSKRTIRRSRWVDNCTRQTPLSFCYGKWGKGSTKKKKKQHTTVSFRKVDVCHVGVILFLAFTRRNVGGKYLFVFTRRYLGVRAKITYLNKYFFVEPFP